MSYSSGLGAAVASPVPTAAPGPFRILPRECERLADAVQSVSSVGPGQVAVIAWPYVTLSDEQVRSALDAIVAAGAAGGGPAVLAGLSSIAAATTATTTSQTGQVSADQVRARAVALAPSFLAAGFIRDSEVDQSVTRGYLWLAASWPSATTSAQALQVLRAILTAAIPAGSMQTGILLAGPGKVSRQSGLTMAASNESDVALEAAAKLSVVGFVQAASALANVFSALLGGRTVSSAAVAMRNEFRTTANKMTNTAAAIDNARAIVGQAGAAAAAALALPAPEQAAAGAQLLSMRRSLASSRDAILSGMQSARPILDTCAAERSDGSPMAMRIRDAIYQDARASVDKKNIPTIGREYAKCQLWKRAQTQLDTELRGLAAEIQMTCLLANGLVDNAPALAALVTQAEAVLGQLDFTMGQLQMDWWQRDYMGVPVMYWLGGAAVAVVGGGVAVRTIRRRRRAAAAMAVAKNRSRA